MLDCIKMVERHIVMPSQATAYKIGMNKILELREDSRVQVGGKLEISWAPFGMFLSMDDCRVI